MVANHNRTKEWFQLAFNNLDRVIRNYEFKDFADCVFRIQLSVEQLQKAILFLLGIKFKKTYEPSRIIDSFLTKKTESLDENIIAKLQKISKQSKDIEKEETKTRYGIIEEGELITPEEEYDRKKTDSFLGDLIQLIGQFKSLIENLEDFQSESKLLENYERLIGEIRENESEK